MTISCKISSIWKTNVISLLPFCAWIRNARCLYYILPARIKLLQIKLLQIKLLQIKLLQIKKNIVQQSFMLHNVNTVVF